MHLSEARLTPSSLKRALLLLLPLALLGTALMGLLAQSAMAATDPVLTASPPPVGNVSTPAWSFTLQATDDRTTTSDSGTVTIRTDRTIECAVTQSLPAPSLATCPVTFDAGSSTYTHRTTDVSSAAGPWYFSVRYTDVVTTTVTDGVESSSTSAPDASGVTTSGPYTYDGTRPTASVSTSPTTGSSTSVTWSIGGTDDQGGPVTLACELLSPTGDVTPVTCSGPSVTTTLTQHEGTWQLAVTARDAAGNDSLPTSASYSLDLPPGAPVVRPPALIGNDVDIQWTFTSSGGTLRCDVTGPNGFVVTPVPCSSPHATSLTGGDGTYVLTVTATDEGGSSQGSASYVLDTEAPSAVPTVTSGQTGTGQATPITWTISTLVDHSAECLLLTDGQPGSWAACAGSYSFAQPVDGRSYALQARYLDTAGNPGTSSPASSPYTYDITAPDALVIAVDPGPAGSDTSPTWTFTPEPGATVTCEVTGPGLPGGQAACSGSGTHTVDLAGKQDGQYVLTVRVTDAGNQTTTTSSTYTLDRAEPATPVIAAAPGAPSSPSPSTAMTWSVDGPADAVRTQCRLERDGVVVHDWADCGTPGASDVTVTRQLDQEGAYRLLVRQYDAAGNVSLVATSAPFVIDSTPPGAALVGGSSTSSPTPTVTWSISQGTPAGTRLSCALVTETTTGAFSDCSGQYTATFTAEGTYRLAVYAYDAAGNRSALTLGPTYRYDATAPGAPSLSVTPDSDDVERATWTVTGVEAGGTTQCRLQHGTTQVFDWRVCTTYTFDLLEGDGAYTLFVRVTDAAGNTGASSAGATYLLDTDPPAAPEVSRTGDPKDNVLTFTITFDKAATETATCQLRTLSGAAVGAAFACVSGQVVSVPDVSGTYVLHVALTDAVGNTGTEGKAAPYELDVTAPAAPAVGTDRVGTDNEEVATFTFTVEGTATCQLLYRGQPVGEAVSCASPYVVNLSHGDGAYQLVVTDTDAVGNTSQATTTAAYVLDLTAPDAPTVAGPPATGNARAVSWTYSGEGTATCTLLLDGVASGVAVSCGATGASASLPGDGPWSLRVTFTDAVGNTGPAGTSSSYLLDTVPPVAPTVSGPTGPAQSRTPSWTVAAESGTTTQCRLVRGSTVVSDWAPCSAGFTGALDGLPDGSYVLESRATDAAQNLGPVGASAPYVLDTTAPLTPVVTGPSGPSQLRNPGFAWTGEAGTSAECQLSLDGTVVGGWVACTSGYAPTLTKDGTWTLAVRLTDAARNVSDVATTGGYVLDTTPPDRPVVTPPKTPGRDVAPSWGAVVEGGASLECRFTGADGVVAEWAACAMPLTTALAGRPDGTYVLEVRATDQAGNLSAVGSGTYVLDTVAPAAAVITSPADGRSRTPSFTWTTEAGATTRCRLTSGSTLISDFVVCTSPAALSLTGLPDGTYTLTVRVADAAGNPGPSATGTYVLDTTGPAAPVLTLSPATPSPSRSITWAFTYEPGSTLVCRFTFPTGAVREIVGCTSPLTVDLTGLPDGSYSLTVRAVDAAGNVGAALTEVHVLDSTALAPPTVTGPVTPGSTRTPRWTITPGGTAGATECRLSRGTTVLRDWAVCTGSFTADLFGQPDGTYVLSARSKDAGGAVSAATTSRYVLDTTAPGAATVVAPPTPSTNRVPTWTLATGEIGATAECRVLVFGSVLQDWAPCAVSVAGAPHAVDLTGLGDGTYTLVVRLTDAAGNRSTVETSSSYVLDTSAPVAVGITGPPSPGNDVTPTWVLSSGSGATLECRLTSAAGVVSDWATCTAEYTADLTGLADGIYTLAVRAVSDAGTPGPESTSAYALNTSAPGAPTALALSSGIKPISNNRSPSWTFTLPAGTTGVCRVVQGTRVVFDGPCSAPFRLDLSGAVDGSYTLTVRALDAAGNLSAAATSTYVLDTEPTAEPVFTQVPGATGSTLDPQWRFSLARGATAQCRLLHDGRPLDDWTTCTTPFTAQLTGRPDGTYVLQVRAVDAAGNTSSPVSDAYLLDRTAAPVPTFTATPPATGFDRTVTWSFSAPDGTTLECRVLRPDGSATAWGACGPVSFALRLATGALLAGGTYALDLSGRADGLYTVEVRAVEADGRRGAAASSAYRLDTRLPDMPSYTDVPETTGFDPKPVWLWDLGSDQLVECRLVRVAGGALTDWQECPGSQYVADLSRLGEGVYALELRVTDAAGNVSPVRSAGYRYDTTAPDAAVFTSRPPLSGADRTVSWTFSAAGGRTTCSITRDRTLVREGPCSGRYDLDLTGLPDGAYTLTVRVTDAAGNTSPASTSTYTLRTVGLAGPVRVDPPSRPAGPVVREEGVPTGPGRGGTGVVGSPGPEGSARGTGVPIQPAEGDVVRASLVGPTRSAPQTQKEGARPQPRPVPTRSNPLLPGALPVQDVPEVLRELVTGTAAKPTLPLALLAIVLLFLLAQNRIDRRDPKLAAAPVEAEPELGFTAFVRRPGSALS